VGEHATSEVRNLITAPYRTVVGLATTLVGCQALDIIHGSIIFKFVGGAEFSSMTVLKDHPPSLNLGTRVQVTRIILIQFKMNAGS